MVRTEAAAANVSAPEAPPLLLLSERPERPGDGEESTLTVTAAALVTPRPGPVDPERCPICKELTRALGTAITMRNQKRATAVLVAMQHHMHQGHPDDPRHIQNGGR
ncbi:hypothetical protein ABZV65_04390 [Streptomyces bauhiniae]|uniref:hypothetical protein n=1 Tax=Streptomyces bauhiniae TaxID=2340725 RepID=UPI0033A5D799